MAAVRILVVEDERITGEDIKRGLKKAGYDVPAIVASGEDAVQKAEKFQPDLVIMDIKLDGEMDGIEAAEKIKSKLDIPVIYLTAYSDETTLQRAKVTQPSGFILKEPFGFLHKPFEDRELHTAIDITLNNHKLEKRFKSQNKWLQTMLSSISDPVISTDSKGKINFMNTPAEDITGFKDKDVLEMDITDIFADLKNLEDFENEFKMQMPRDLVLKIKKGAQIKVDGSVNPVLGLDDKLEGYTVIFRPKPS
ncbi:MAG: histidine kinase [Methanobacteriales archaeon Met13]